MNDWVRDEALSANKRSVTNVQVGINSLSAVVALYALSPAQIEVGGGAGQTLVAIRIDRLALHRAHQGKNHGTSLLQHACKKALAAAEIIPARHVVVEAINEPVARWYEDRGFERTRTGSLDLTMSMKSLRSTLELVNGATPTGP